MIPGIELPKLRNSEYIQFMRDSSGIVQANDPVVLKVKDEHDQLITTIVALEGLFVKQQGSALTEDIALLDARRDRAVTGINTTINGYTYHFDPVLANHASNLSFQIGQYGSGIAKENYQSETAIITSLVADFKTKPDLVAAVTALGLDAWVTELEDSNKAFNSAYLQRTQQLGAANQDATIVEKRLECNANYYLLRDFIVSYFTINKGAAPYDKVTAELTVLIEQYNAMIAGRLSPTKDETPKSPTPPSA